MSQKSKKSKKVYYKKEIDQKSEDSTKDPRYDLFEDEEEQPPDFSYLLNLHTSSTSHLILKSDQERYEKAESVINTSKYFKVDLNLLNSAIKSVPFSVLHDIIGIEWTAEELNHMNETAKLNEENYKSLLAKSSNHREKEVSPQIVTKEIEQLKISPSKSRTIDSATVAPDNKESMEKWLDDVLDL